MSTYQRSFIADAETLVIPPLASATAAGSAARCPGRRARPFEDQLTSVPVCRGELLPGFHDDRATLERERLEAPFPRTLQRRLERFIEERRWPAVLAWGERRAAPGHAPEPGHPALMLAHAEPGDRPRVAQGFRRYREALFNDLGVEPSAATRRLYDRLRQDETEPTTAAAAPPVAAAVLTTGRRTVI